LKKKLRVAAATHGKKGLKDVISEVFGKANTFTLIDINDGEIQVVRIAENPARSYEHGAGPIAVKELADSGVDLVIAPQIGHGASSMLRHHSIAISLAKGGTTVAQAVEEALKGVPKK
jgi:predicted Fe-Mo cluster-binding NifX family protein